MEGWKRERMDEGRRHSKVGPRKEREREQWNGWIKEGMAWAEEGDRRERGPTDTLQRQEERTQRVYIFQARVYSYKQELCPSPPDVHAIVLWVKYSFLD